MYNRLVNIRSPQISFLYTNDCTGYNASVKINKVSSYHEPEVSTFERALLYCELLYEGP